MNEDQKKLLAGLRVQYEVLEDEVEKGHIELADVSIMEAIATLSFLHRKIHGE